MESVDKKDESTGDNSDLLSFKEITESAARTENNIEKQDISKNNGTEETSNNINDDSDILKLACEDDDDNDDDIPGDFFDDFLKEDFMAGLDIVDDDDWDEAKSKSMHEARVNNKEENEKTSRNVDVKGKDDKKVELRRDPEKTRRDIEMDKAKQKKDRENQVLIEKIKLSKTGLVPPGMEMEVDVTETKQQLGSNILKKDEVTFANIPQDKPPAKIPLLREHVQNRTLLKPENLQGKRSSLINRFENHSGGRSRGIKHKGPMFTPIFNSREPRIRSRSPRGFIVRSKSPRRQSRSPRRLSRSPRRLSRSRDRLSRSPRRRTRSPRRKSRSPRRRSRSPRRGNRRRSRSSDKKKSDRSRNSRSRSRESRNHRRKEVEKKKSFLQEIAEKLNETSMPANIVYHPGSVQPRLQTEYPLLPQQLFPLENPPPMNPMIPPPPTQYHPQGRFERYDEHFFIGEPHIPPNVANSFNIPVLPNPPAVHNVPEAMDNMNEQVPSSKTQEDVKKLFEEKKISLTDFLAVTAKPEVYAASPANLKEKIKVITRCQEAIKYLEQCEKKFSGPLIIQKKFKPDQNPQQYQSPFLKSSQLRFPFTEGPSADKQKSDFGKYIQNLLEHINIESEVIVIDDNCATDDETSTNKSPSPKVFTQKSKKGEIITPNSNYSRNRLQKFVQTDPDTCKKCGELRNRKVRSFGVQTANEPLSFSVSTQVREDDFYPTMSKQSLAALTPAQLLARSSGRGPGLDAAQNRPANFPYSAEPHRMGIPLPRGSNYDPRMNRDHNQWQI